MTDTAPQRPDKDYRTRPFLAGDYGGIHGYNVPVQELLRLYEAFATLTPGLVIELLIDKLTTAEPLLQGFVEVFLCMDKQTSRVPHTHTKDAWVDCSEYQSVYPDNENWQEIQLYAHLPHEHLS